jgi:class 3 adenylate cyclase
VFTDVEGSTRLWQEHPGAMAIALARHDEIMRAAIAVHRRYVFSTAGDAFAAAFARPGDAVDAAVEALGLRSKTGLSQPYRY